VFPYYCIYDTSNDIIKNNTILFTLLAYSRFAWYRYLSISFPVYFFYLASRNLSDNLRNGLSQEGGTFSGLRSFIDRRFAFGNH
jgi:hypothetical protein